PMEETWRGMSQPSQATRARSTPASAHHHQPVTTTPSTTAATSGGTRVSASVTRRTLTSPRETGVKVSPAGSKGLGAGVGPSGRDVLIGVLPPGSTTAACHMRGPSCWRGSGGFAVVLGGQSAPVLDDQGHRDECEARQRRGAGGECVVAQRGCGDVGPGDEHLGDEVAGEGGAAQRARLG